MPYYETACLDQLIDPRTKRVIAACGRIWGNADLPGEYWVSIGNRPPEFFSSEESARQFYKDSIAPLKAGLRTRGLRGYGSKRLALAAGVGK